jgi:hypothetical protein
MIETFDMADTSVLGDARPSPALALESGNIIRIERHEFSLTEAEQALIAAGPAVREAKNISFNPADRSLKGTSLPPEAQQTLTNLLSRYGDHAESLLRAAIPAYARAITRGRTSFRPAEIAGRALSWRKDDRRRHVDAFPSTPTHGRRILRVFLNVDPNDTPRRWRAGPSFEAYARTFLPTLRRPVPGAGRLLAALGITKTRRTIYDQLMLGLHDAAKRDSHWQETTQAEDIAFPPGACWMVFTDQVPHAALSGRNALEQSFYIDPAGLQSPEQSPARILARLTGRDVLQPV